ncbi:MAG TPA: pyridoxal phosphate-dependent aminotransferase [Sphingomicrobium sp.]|nr:pyridoxal phosphate-dependent aminotransferase [Sphingomicrobium sp.]
MASSDGLRAPEMSYARWVRRELGRVRSSQKRIVTLFDSSVPEPVDLLRETITAGFSTPITSRYTSAFVDGNPYVIETLARRYGVSRAQVLCTTGATGALSLVYRALMNPSERVLIEQPGFDLFHGLARSYGLEVDYFARRGPRFVIDPEEVAARIRPETRLIIITNLHNPSGMTVDEPVLQALAEIAEFNNLYVVVDEVYGDYADAAVRPRAAAQISPRLISVNSLTKIYGLSTLRCGWIVAAPEVLAPIRALSEEVEFGVSNLAHAVAALVLERSDQFDGYRDEIIDRCRPIIEAYWARWRDDELIEGELPDFGCVSFPKLTGIDDTEEFSIWLADRSGVIVAPGEFFGALGHIRIGHAQLPGDLEQGLEELTAGLKIYRDVTPERRKA